MERTRSVEVLKSRTGRQYHIGLKPGEVAPTILLCGDPARAGKIAQRFDRIRARKGNREFLTFTGVYHGVPVSVMATGIGPDNMEIAVIELSQIVRDAVMIRAGSCGALQRDIRLGDLVISRSALALETTSQYFRSVSPVSPSHPEVLQALIRASTEQKFSHHVGLTATAPGFYGAQGRKVPGFPLRDPRLPERLARRGVLNLEMEISTLFGLARLARLRAGAVCAVYANRPRNTFVDSRAKIVAERHCIETALRACLILSGK